MLTNVRYPRSYRYVFWERKAKIFVKMPPHKFGNLSLSCAKKKRSAAEVDTASFCGIFTLILCCAFNPKIHKVLSQDITHRSSASLAAKGKKMILEKSRGCIFCFFGAVLQKCASEASHFEAQSGEKIKRYTRRSVETISLLPEFIEFYPQ